MGKRLTDAERQVRLAEQAQQAKTALQESQRRLAGIQAKQRKVAQAQTHTRRLKWGGMLDTLGLLQLDDTTLHEVLTVARTIVERHGARMPWTKNRNGDNTHPQGSLAAVVELDNATTQTTIGAIVCAETAHKLQETP
jgi:hypothetical protein